MRKRLAMAAVLIALAAGAYLGWRFFDAERTDDGALSGSGTIEATEVAVSALMTGRIVSVTATEGTAVRRGDALFRIDPSVAALLVDQATAGLDAAKAAWDEAKKDNVSDADIAVAKARHDQAKAQVGLAELQLSYSTVTAPIDGTVLDVALDAGEIASAGKTLATLARLDRLTVSVYVPERSIGDVALGQRATLTVDASTDEYVCRVTFISSTAEFTPAQVQTKDQRAKLVYEVRLSVSDPSGTLKPGMPADVVFE